jgi:hypothetical protein
MFLNAQMKQCVNVHVNASINGSVFSLLRRIIKHDACDGRLYSFTFWKYEHERARVMPGNCMPPGGKKQSLGVASHITAPFFGTNQMNSMSEHG